jgi:copper chaperone CopZ
MTPITLHIDGMSCGHCLNAVNRALSSVPGATVQSVQLGRAEVGVDAASQDVKAALVAAVEAAGYHATVVASG